MKGLELTFAQHKGVTAVAWRINPATVAADPVAAIKRAYEKLAEHERGAVMREIGARPVRSAADAFKAYITDASKNA